MNGTAVSNKSSQQELIVGLVQLELRKDQESPRQAIQRAIELMKSEQTTKHKVDLLVLPELAPVGYSEHTFQEYLGKNKAIWDDLKEVIQQTARELGVYISFGTVGMESNQQEQLFIQQTVVDPKGRIASTYRKTYLCDYGDCAETRYFSGGNSMHHDEAARVENVFAITKGSVTWKIGTILCADMRYVLPIRSLVQHHDIDVILQPAAFARDVSFRTWQPFRETRAVEHGIYWVAVNYAGSIFGSSAVIPPWVDSEHPPVEADTIEQVLIATLSKDILEQARCSFPFHRAVQAGR